MCAVSLRHIQSLLAPLLNSSSLDLISASFLYVLAMFFIPAVFLGIPVPILTTPALSRDSRTGRVVGRLHATCRHTGPYSRLPERYRWLYREWLRGSAHDARDNPCHEI